jgi:hypothetical protein
VDFLKTLSDGFVPAEMTLDASILSARLERGKASEMTAQRTFHISNAGAGALPYTVTADVPWVSINPASGSCTAEQDPIVVTFDQTGLTADTYTGVITVTDPTAPANTATLQLQMTVTKPAPDSSGGGSRCGSVGLDLMAPLAVLWLLRRRRDAARSC